MKPGILANCAVSEAMGQNRFLFLGWYNSVASPIGEAVSPHVLLHSHRFSVDRLVVSIVLWNPLQQASTVPTA